MTYEEWLKSIQFGLKRRYKVTDIVCGDYGIRIIFDTNFVYGINEYALKDLWKRDGFSELCKDVEKAYMNQIMNI